MSERQLRQSDLEDISAYLDGQLDPSRAGEVEEQIRTQPAWSRAHRRLRALDEALGAYTVPPAPADLADRILDNIQARPARRPVVIRLARWLAPVAAAAAAAVLVVALISYMRPAGPQRPTRPGSIAPSGERIAEKDRFIVENLGFFRDYDVIENLETLEAIERLQSKGREI